MSNLYIGLMSGTSADAIDAVLVDFDHESPRLVASVSHAITDKVKQEILSFRQIGENELDRMAKLDVKMGHYFAQAVIELMSRAGEDTPLGKSDSGGFSGDGPSYKDIVAIGSHGQTLRHSPDSNPAYTVQIGDPNIISQLTGIKTIADFRRRDIAAGGQGAPLVPAFHDFYFSSPGANRVILNVGGIANITALPGDDNKDIVGFDTGPGNCLMDEWIFEVLGKRFDENGEWASQGEVNLDLLDRMLSDPYFAKAAPKSTGPDYFNLSWLLEIVDRCGCRVDLECYGGGSIQGNDLAGKLSGGSSSVNKSKNDLGDTGGSNLINAKDVQATLLELTARSIATSVEAQFVDSEIFVCGGGVHNKILMERIQDMLPKHKVESTSSVGIDPDWVEAIAFAWLAKQRIEGGAGNVPSVTGAKQKVMLGGVF